MSEEIKAWRPVAVDVAKAAGLLRRVRAAMSEIEALHVSMCMPAGTTGEIYPPPTESEWEAAGDRLMALAREVRNVHDGVPF